MCTFYLEPEEIANITRQIIKLGRIELIVAVKYISTENVAYIPLSRENGCYYVFLR